MKKIILSTLAIVCVSAGVMAQGSLGSINNTGIYFGSGAGSQDTSSSSVYTGALTLEVFFSTTATSQEAAAINALNGANNGGSQAFNLLTGDGFTEVSTTDGTTVGGVTGVANANSAISGFAATIDLSSAYAANTAGYLVLYFIGANGASGAFAFTGNYGGQQLQNPIGTPYNLSNDSALTGLASAQNLALTTAVPEPTTMALAGLGGLSLFLLRRKKIT